MSNQSIDSFVKENEITIETEWADENPNSYGTWQANHYEVKLIMGVNSFGTHFSKGYALKGSPNAAEVLDCLASDVSSIENTDSFEEWADDLGYDTDSRKAEKIFNVIKDQSSRLEEFLGGFLFKVLIEEVERQ